MIMASWSFQSNKTDGKDLLELATCHRGLAGYSVNIKKKLPKEVTPEEEEEEWLVMVILVGDGDTFWAEVQMPKLSGCDELQSPIALGQDMVKYGTEISCHFFIILFKT